MGKRTDDAVFFPEMDEEKTVYCRVFTSVPPLATVKAIIVR